jgi:hypothetical protein
VIPRTFLVLTFLISAVALVAHAQTVSPDGSSITPSSGGSLVTADGTWTFGTATQAWGTEVLLNGQLADGAYGVELYVTGGKIYNKVGGSSPGWWVYQSGTWTQTTDPTLSGGGTSPANNSCTNYYTGSVATPTGYGASYDLFSTQHELEVNVDCSGSSPVLKVGSGSSSQYIYHQGYVYQSSSWQPVTFTSNSSLISSAWYTGSAQATLTNTSPASWVYVVGYVCYWNGTAWLCGCANTSCATSYWQLQAFEAQSSGTDSNGSGEGGQWAGQPDANAIVIAPSGNDGNPCNVSAPCETLGRAQQAVEASSDKTVYLRAGMYNGQSVSLGSADSGETWMTYPGDAVDSAVLDGGDSVGDAFDLNGVSNVTINGLKMQNFATHTIQIYGGPGYGGAIGSGVVVENCDIGKMNAAPPVENAFAVSGIVIADATKTTVENNYFHDLASESVQVGAYTPGQTIDGTIITGNVILNVALQSSDIGAMGVGMHANNNSGGHVTISNNFIVGWGAAGYDNMRPIYIDDSGSNVAVTGNVIGPPNPGVSATFINAVFTNGGDGDSFTGNLIDIGNYNTSYVIYPTNGPGQGGSLSFTWTEADKLPTLP